MNELIEKIEKWAKDRELDSADSGKQMLKVMEELGEVAAAIVRGDRASLRDSIGDSVVTLIILAMQNDMDIYECLNCAYDEIKDRTGEVINGSFVKSSDLELKEPDEEKRKLDDRINKLLAAKERLKYTDEFIKQGGTMSELFNDETFLMLVEKEKKLC